MPDVLAKQSTASVRRRVTWAGVAFILLIIGADAYEAWQDYRATVARSERTLTGLSSALAGQTARMIEEIDVGMQDYAAWNAGAAGQSASLEETREQLRRQVAAFPFVHSAAVFGSDGHMRFTTRAGELSGFDLSAAPVFAMHARGAADTLYVSTPVVGRTDRYLTFALSRRLQDSSGRFAGIVAARMSFEYLTRFYAAVDISPGG
ncbi:MAG: PDC sensor domain-containing protein, partial [Steroidobacterales bacterium]